MGRRKKYDENEFPLLAEKYARKGLNDKEIAKSLGISLAVYYVYQNDYPEFKEAIKRGKHPVDVAVENALLKRALGYTYEEKSTEFKVDAKGSKKPSVIKTTTKRVPPDVGAIAFWLKNRNPDEWSDRKEMNVSVHQEQPFFPDVQEDNGSK